MKKDTFYALLGLFFTSAGALCVLWLVFVSENPELFEQKKEQFTHSQVQEEEWQVGEYTDLLHTSTPVPEKIEQEEQKVSENVEQQESFEEVEPNTTVIPVESAAGKIIEGAITEEIIVQNFYTSTVSQELKERILQGLTDTEQYEELLLQQSYIHVLHYDFEGNVTTGELLVYTGIAQAVLDIFKQLFEAQYPIEKIRLIHEYGWDDTASMLDNNTSAFNFRKIAGSNAWSKHALGMAIDINPLYNPYVYSQGSTVSIQPKEAYLYADRSTDCAYYIKSGDVCYEAFVSRGFTWGGDWDNPKDYQHFQVGKE